MILNNGSEPTTIAENSIYIGPKMDYCVNNSLLYHFYASIIAHNLTCRDKI